MQYKLNVFTGEFDLVQKVPSGAVNASYATTDVSCSAHQTEIFNYPFTTIEDYPFLEAVVKGGDDAGKKVNASLLRPKPGSENTQGQINLPFDQEVTIKIFG